MPGRQRSMGGRVVGIDADDLDLLEILERVVFEIDQLTADDEVKQLLRGTIWHGGSSRKMPGKHLFLQASGRKHLIERRGNDAFEASRHRAASKVRDNARMAATKSGSISGALACKSRAIRAAIPVYIEATWKAFSRTLSLAFSKAN